QCEVEDVEVPTVIVEAAAGLVVPDRSVVSVRNFARGLFCRCSFLSPAQRLFFFPLPFFPLPFLVTAEAPCHQALPAIDRSVFSLFRFRPIPAAAELPRCNK